MSQIRNIYLSIIAILALALMASAEPLIFTIGSLILIIGYLIIQRGLIPFLNELNHDEYRTQKRKNALKEARIFLAPYDDIWRSLRLSNKHCILSLELDGITIMGTERVAPYRKFRIMSSPIHDYRDLWEMFCKSFSHSTTYSGLLKSCQTYKVSVYEYSTMSPSSNSSFSNKLKNINKSNTIALKPDKENTEKIDINNCSEVELTALPGISIVMAKKAIKKREEIGGYKRVEDFFIFMRLKPHMEAQLIDKVCVNKMKCNKKNIDRNQERSVDL